MKKRLKKLYLNDQMKNFVFFFLFSHILCAEPSEWFLKTMVEIEKAKSLPLEEQMNSFGVLLIKGERSVDSEGKQVFERIRNQILSTPGHAKYCQEKIETLRIEVLANSKKTNAQLTDMQQSGLEVKSEADYLMTTPRYLYILGLLPSYESVAVLGYFLNDPESRDGKTLLGNERNRQGVDSVLSPINAEQAALSIRKLSIERPPFQTAAGSVSSEEVDAWRDWWNEVKDGKRTYRFIGSPVEYGPDGPASVEVIQRAQLNLKRDEERAAGHKKGTPVAGAASVIHQVRKPVSLAGIIAACALVAGAVWYMLRGRRAVRQ